MNNLLRNTRIQITSLLILLVICAYALWSYIFSFQTVTFTFDQKLGYIELLHDNTKLYPVNNQPIKLKKGEYVARNIGTSIAPNPRTVTINETKRTLHVEFDYTQQYLDTLYESQRTSIEAGLFEKYPIIKDAYRLQYGKLYHHGEIYGASLVAIDKSGDNTDTLHVIMKKKDSSWHVASRPPTPILSAPDYPDIDASILRAINQER